MKVMKKGLAMLLALVLLSMTLAACGSDTTQSVDVSLESADTDGNSSALASEETSTEAVSYTHLDVYKRQRPRASPGPVSGKGMFGSPYQPRPEDQGLE